MTKRHPTAQVLIAPALRLALKRTGYLSRVSEVIRRESRHGHA
jgi:hypothetical protein